VWQIYLCQNGHLCLSEAILRYGRFTPFKKEQDAILALFKGTQNVVFLRDHIRSSLCQSTPRYSPDFYLPFSKTIVITAAGGWISSKFGYIMC